MNGTHYMQILIDKMADNMKFVGMFYIIIGGFYCFTIIGAIVGVPLIISGLQIRESASAFQNYSFTNDQYLLEQALSKQNSFFKIQKIIMIVSLVFMVIYIVFLLVVGISFFQNLGSTDSYSV
jgi:hypothetical protein